MISIIVPVYQVEQYLRQCVESILNQAYKQFELLLIDDESTDSSGEICEEFAAIDPRIRVYHIPHSGLSAARNKGMEESRGEWIGFVDSDDWIEPDMYNSLLSVAEKEGADIAVCGVVDHTDQRQKASSLKSGTFTSSEALEMLLTGSINNTVWNKLYRKEFFASIRFPEGRNYEDIAIQHLLFHKAQTITVIDDIAYHYRVREGSIAHTYSARNLLDYADAYMDRFRFYSALDEASHEDGSADGCEKKKKLLRMAALGISRVWRWWHGCTKAEKEQNQARIQELKQFACDHLPVFGYRSWGKGLRISTFFMHYDSQWSFAVAYFLNKMYRNVKKLT